MFSLGKSDSNPKKDDFKKHEISKDHISALRASKLRNDMVRATQYAYSNCKSSIIAAMKTVLCLAQEDVPNSKVGAIIQLQIENVSYFTYLFVFIFYFV